MKNIIVFILTASLLMLPIVDAQSSGFIETWDGVPGTPQPWSSARWVTMPYAGDGLVSHDDFGNQIVEWHDIEAGHGSHCEAPLGNADVSLNNHTIPKDPQRSQSSVLSKQQYKLHEAPMGLYICNNHLMSVEKSGTAANSFMPRYMADWSGGRTQTISFDVNPYSHAREWWDLYIAPISEFTLDTSILSKRAVVFGMISGAGRVQEVANYRPVQWESGRYDSLGGQAYCDMQPIDPACDDPKIRRTVIIKYTTTTFDMSIARIDGSVWRHQGLFPTPLNFTQGAVMISHWSYNPTKDGIVGKPWSQYTYHWDNFAIDGPVPSFGMGYPFRGWIDTSSAYGCCGPLGKNPTDIFHVNINSANLQNPRLWGVLTDAAPCGQVGCDIPSRSDSADNTRWVEARVNNGPWLPLPSVRDPGSVFVDHVNSLNLTTSHTFRQTLDIGSVFRGDNTIQFRSNNGDGFNIEYVEIQVDPNEDLPGPGGLPPIATSTSVLPTQTMTVGTIINFDDTSGQNRLLTGVYDGINWGSSSWYLSAPWGAFATKSVSFTDTAQQQGTFTFVNQSILASVKAYNGSLGSATVTLACANNPPIIASVPAQQVITITTSWSVLCSNVTITTTNGWDTNFDDFALGTTTIVPTATPLPCYQVIILDHFTPVIVVQEGLQVPCP